MEEDRCLLIAKTSDFGLIHGENVASFNNSCSRIFCLNSFSNFIFSASAVNRSKIVPLGTDAASAVAFLDEPDPMLT